MLAVSTDYHQNRRYRKNTGLIIRNGELLYTDTVQDSAIRAIPDLDSLLLTRDGGFEVYPATELTPAMAEEKGACDVLSFGPVLLKDGRWRYIYVKEHASIAPRMALAKLGEDHYLLVFAEGRKKEAVGMSLDRLQELLIVRGATDAINMDGGGTACMYFMGQSVGLSEAKGPKLGRSQYELLTIGEYKTE